MAFARNIALSMTPSVQQAAALIRAQLVGASVEEFGDGLSFEAAISAKRFDAVVDLALGDLVDDRVCRERLTAAAMSSVPQVLVPGGLDICAPRVLDRVSKDLAWKASASRGPVVILIPERGWSDQHELAAENLRVLTAGLRLWLSPQVVVEIVGDAIASAAFAARVATTIARLTASTASS